MPFTFVQGNATTNTDAKADPTSVVWGSARGVGNLLVLCTGSNALVTTPTGWTLGPSAINTAAAYLYYRIADNTATDAPTIDNNWTRALTWLEYSGNAAIPLDVTATAITGNGTSSIGVGPTDPPAQADALAIAFLVGLDSNSLAIWDNAFTDGFSKIAGANASQASDGISVVCGVATKPLSSTGAVSTSDTTSEAMSFGCHSVLAVFKAAAGGGSTGQPMSRRWGGVPHVGAGTVASPGSGRGRTWGRTRDRVIVPRRFAA